MTDLEAALAAHLDGKFFWEPTTSIEDTKTIKAIVDIRKAQKPFNKDAKHVTPGSVALEYVETNKPVKKVALKGEQRVIEPIISAIAHVYNIPASDLLGTSTSQTFYKAKRHLYWAVMNRIPKMSYSEAGRLLKKNHSTVMHGAKEFHANQDHEKIVAVDRVLGLI